MATGLVLLVVIESKFTHGAWIILVLIPLLVTMFRAVNYHYRDMREQVTLKSADIRVGEHWGVPQQHKVVVPLSSLNRASLAALRFACSISQDVTAVIVMWNRRAQLAFRRTGCPGTRRYPSSCSRPLTVPWSRPC